MQHRNPRRSLPPFPWVLTALLASLAPLAARAEIITFTAHLDGEHAFYCSGSGSPATGDGTWVLDSLTGEVDYTITVDLEALQGTETESHVHGSVAPCSPGGRARGQIYPLPLGSPKTGSVVLSPHDQQDMISGLHYMNVHTTAWPGGEEITGWILPATVGCSYTVAPAAGTLPLATTHTVTLTNAYPDFARRVAARIDVQLGGGQAIGSWRSGYTQLSPGAGYTTTFNLSLPASAALVGPNVFFLQAEDVTPSPFNQPPYPPAGDTSSDAQTVVAAAP